MARMICSDYSEYTGMQNNSHQRRAYPFTVFRRELRQPVTLVETTNLRGTLGFIDGAVNGMVTRLLSVGFTPDEAKHLAHAAYLPVRKRTATCPATPHKRSYVSTMINRAYAALEAGPNGVQAHLIRIALTEMVFMNAGSWIPKSEYTEDQYEFLVMAKQTISAI